MVYSSSILASLKVHWNLKNNLPGETPSLLISINFFPRNQPSRRALKNGTGHVFEAMEMVTARWAPDPVISISRLGTPLIGVVIPVAYL